METVAEMQLTASQLKVRNHVALILPGNRQRQCAAGRAAAWSPAGPSVCSAAMLECSGIDLRWTWAAPDPGSAHFTSRHCVICSDKCQGCLHARPATAACRCPAVVRAEAGEENRLRRGVCGRGRRCCGGGRAGRGRRAWRKTKLESRVQQEIGGLPFTSCARMPAAA